MNTKTNFLPTLTQNLSYIRNHMLCLSNCHTVSWNDDNLLAVRHQHRGVVCGDLLDRLVHRLSGCRIDKDRAVEDDVLRLAHDLVAESAD